MLAERMNHLGTETAFEVLARANALEAEGREIINLGIGQPDFQTPEHIVEAAIKALRDGHHGYTPASGIPPLRQAISDDIYRRHDVKVEPDRILAVPGGKVTMFLAMMIYGEPVRLRAREFASSSDQSSRRTREYISFVFNLFCD